MARYSLPSSPASCPDCWLDKSPSAVAKFSPNPPGDSSAPLAAPAALMSPIKFSRCLLNIGSSSDSIPGCFGVKFFANRSMRSWMLASWLFPGGVVVGGGVVAGGGVVLGGGVVVGGGVVAGGGVVLGGGVVVGGGVVAGGGV